MISQMCTTLSTERCFNVRVLGKADRLLTYLVPEGGTVGVGHDDVYMPSSSGVDERRMIDATESRTLPANSAQGWSSLLCYLST
jgi:hypothetical protein